LNGGEYALRLGRHDEAVRRLRESLRIAAEIDDRRGTVWALAYLAATEVEGGRPERAGRTWGAIEVEEQRGRIGQWEAENDEVASLVLAGAGPEFEQGRAEGRRLSLPEAVAAALST